MNSKFTIEEVKAACEFLLSLGQFKLEEEGLGSTKYFRITAHGTLEHERSGE